MKTLFAFLGSLCCGIAATFLIDILQALLHFGDFWKGFVSLPVIGLFVAVPFLVMIWDELPEGKTEKQKMYEAYMAGDRDSYAVDRCSHEIKTDFEKAYAKIMNDDPILSEHQSPRVESLAKDMEDNYFG